jgi:tetratricopeptide (TPR) repeat protein
MAPEQMAGQPDARSDQFSFCVALFEALYHFRPFVQRVVDPDGETRTVPLGKDQPSPTQMMSKREASDLLAAPPPPDSGVPRWLHQAIIRGLSPHPGERFADMDALLAILRHDPAARWRRLGVAAAVVIAAGGAAAIAARAAHREPSTVCHGAEARLEGVWDATRRDAVEKAFRGTPLPYAPDTFARAARALDDYGRGWVAMRTSACEATRLRGEQSEELLDLRMACLDGRLQALAAQVEVFAHADVTVVDKAVSATRDLPPLAACADAAALRAPLRAPTDPDQRARIAEARQDLATSGALMRSGKYPEALAIATRAAQTATAVHFAPLLAEAFYELADLQEKNDDYKGTVETLREAGRAAESAGDDRTAAHVLAELVFVTGTRLARFDEARELAADAQAKIDRIGPAAADPTLLFDLDHAVGGTAFAEGKWHEATVAFQHAVALLENRGNDLKLALALMSLAAAQIDDGQLDEGVANHRRAVALLEQELGPDHPYLGYATLNLGYALHRQTKEVEAQAMLERCLRIQEHRADDIVTAMAHDYLGDVLRTAGKTDEALPHLERALTLIERLVGPDHPHVREVLLALGLLRLDRGEPALAAPLLERSVAGYEKAGGDPRDIAENRFALARALWDTGDKVRARKLAEDAATVLPTAKEWLAAR